ncbi:hypothetical protein EN817_30670 [Mesorhizobium sp. M3A.F.Ca.ET.174.01.1.1]|nr:hypothetical protein EN817_30670 [Mesorhizobium sp. M3A.F.Ca.ET.174.01.1.1]
MMTPFGRLGADVAPAGGSSIVQTAILTAIGAKSSIQADNWLTIVSSAPIGAAPINLIWRKDGG